jgi:predicted methyltransferase
VRGAQLLAFLELGRGDRVADLGSGVGYSIVPLAHAVGPQGVIYVRQLPVIFTELPKDTYTDPPRKALPPNVVHMDTPDDAPFARGARDLDLVTLLFEYHDDMARGRDLKKLHLAVFRALRPGRFYVIADRAAPEGTDLETAKRLNESEQAAVRHDVQAAGFSFVEAAELLSSSGSEAQPHGADEPQTSQYLLKFVKPQ